MLRGVSGRLTYVGAVGSGFNDQVLAELMPKLRALEADRSPFTVASPKRTLATHWARPELVANVDIAEWTAGGKIRQPSFRSLRDDKDPRDIVDERPD